MEDLKQYANIPSEMREMPHWLIWRLEDRGRPKSTKTPYSPQGGPGKVNDLKTWGTFGEAIMAGQKGGYNGVGFVFTDTPFVAIDIDDCRNPVSGEVTPEALEIINRLQSYTELSQSGTGFHIVVRGKLPNGRRRSGPYEMYGHGSPRYFAMTGNMFGEPRTIRECQAEIDAIHREYIQGERDNSPMGISTGEGMERAAADSDDMYDGELIARMLKSKHGVEIRALWDGDTSAHGGDDSAADMALCNYLAFYTRKNAQAMDRLFRRSGLMRPKWDERRGRNTYGDLTIQRAISDCRAVYDPEEYFKKKGGADGRRLAELHPEKNDRYQWTDIGDGRLFADWFKDRARYVPDRKKWFYYDGQVWRADVGGVRVMEWCKELADKLILYALSLEEGSTKKDFMRHAQKWQQRSRRETILKDAATVHPVDWSEFDTDPMLFNCLNGTLDLGTRKFSAHNPADMLTKISGVSYNPEARSSRWDRFILEIMEDDREKALFLQKALGYALTGGTQFECFFILYGPTSRNGKGTCMETIITMLGDYGRTARPETITQKQGNNGGSGPSEDIARLAGARFVNIPEPDKKMVLSSALVKTLTGNDTINARYLNENSFEYRPQFKLFINTNYLPSVTDPTLFSSGRVNVIPFEHHFGEDERDPGLKAELAKPQNLSGILNWCLDGLWMLNETGFEIPASVKAATDEYRQHSDKMGRFLADEMEADPLAEARTEDVYRRYQDWCARNGHGVENKANFKSMLGNVTTVRKKRPQGAGRTVSPQWLVEGYRLKPFAVAEIAGNF